MSAFVDAAYYYGKKKKKIGRPPGGHSNLENGPRKPGKRGRRRRRYGPFIERKRPSADSEETNNSEPREEEIPDDDTNSTGSLERRGEDHHEPTAKRRKKRRDYNHRAPPPTTITTRGVKGPKYSFERKTHKKVLLPPHMGKSPRKRKHTDEEQSFMQSEVRYLWTPAKILLIATSANLLWYRVHDFMLYSLFQSHSSYSLAPEDLLVLDTNPLLWSVQEVVDFLLTTDCANLVRIFKEQVNFWCFHLFELD